MAKFIELIDKYEIRQSDSDEYNPPSYIWTDNTGEIIRCKDCKHYYEKEWVVGGGSYTTCWYQTIANAQPNDFCSRAERKEE